jgi:subfamily B ATP-binding cassette protein MsbA
MDARGNVINWGGIARHVFPLGTRGANGPLAKIAGRYAGYLPLVGVLGLLTSLIEGISVGLLVPLLGLLMTDTLPTSFPGPIRVLFGLTLGHSAEARIVLTSTTVMALIVLRGLLQTANSVLIAWVDGCIGRDVRSALSSRLLGLRYGFFLEHDASRLVDVIATDSWFVTDASRSLLAMVPAVLALFVFAIFLVWFDWRLFLVATLGALVIRGAMHFIEVRLRQLSRAISEANHALAERMLGIVLSMRVIRIFGQQPREQARFSQSADGVRRAMFRTQRLAAALAPGVDALTSILFIAILVIGYRMGLSIAMVTAFVVLLSRAQPHVRAISEGRIKIATVRSSIEQVEWLLSEPEPQPPQGEMQPPADLPIRFDRVCYTYPNGNAALHDISFTLPPGGSTALIGASGAGKSTIVNLLFGLLEPQSGSITVGGIPLAAIARDVWCERIAIAGQDVELVEGTIAENIAYGRPGASRAEIEEAARTAGAHGFVAALPDGYETRVGQEGTRVSGGERQRIGIARALLRNSDLLILDEATSAVDPLSEQELMRLLADRRHFRTALIISHRRSTVSVCQDGIVIDHGKVCEAGPLRELEYYRAMAGEPEWS